MVLLVAPCLPHGPAPTEWPLERIVANLEKRLKEAPDDAAVHYNLGRAHAFAFALKRSRLWIYGGDDSPISSIDNLENQDRREKPSQANDPTLHGPAPEPAERLVHLREGVQHLRRSCELEPKNFQFHLTLAWLVETGAPLGDALEPASVFGPSTAALAPERTAAITGWIADLGAGEREKSEGAQRALSSPDTLEQASPLLYMERDSASAQRKKVVRELLQRLWTERAIREYWSTFELAMAADMAEETLSLGIEGFKGLVSYEALDAYRRLVRQRGASASEEKNLAAADESCKQLEAKPRSSWITPLVLALDCRSLDELVTPDLSVPFDLDGDCVDELWPWIAPDAGWLVWDPHHSGEITSGRQLFGSASAWLFFEDGYRVLDALDDDRDGKLEGAELDGIAVWFDRNTNGVSDRGEVVPVAELGIVALATQSALSIGASPANLCGLEMADGRVLPTYDWVLQSIEE